MRRVKKHESTETWYSVVVGVGVIYASATVIGWVTTMPVLITELETAYSGTPYVEAQASLVISLGMAICCLSNFLFAMLGRVLDVRIIGSVSALVLGAGVALSPRNLSLSWWVLTYSLPCGFAFACQFSVLTTVQSRYFDRNLGLMAGLGSCATGLATFAYPQLWSYLTLHSNFQTAMHVFAAILASAMLPALLFKPVTPRPDAPVNPVLINDSANERVLVDDDEASSSGSLQNDPLSSQSADESTSLLPKEELLLTKCQRLKKLFHVELLYNKSFVVMSCGIAMSMVGQAIVSVHLNAFAKQYFPNENTNMITSLIGICQAVSKLLCAWLVDHLPIKVSYYIVQVGQVSSAIMALVLSFLIPNQSHFLLLLLAACLNGICESPSFAMLLPILCRFVRKDIVAVAMGYQVILIGVATMIGPPSAGLLYDFTLSYALCYQCATVATLSGAIIMFFVDLDKDHHYH